MNENDKLILVKNGWTIECENPFEIRNEETGDFASGVAAKAVLDSLPKFIDDKEKIDTIIDYLYSCYEAEISLQNVRYIHPMFYNGTFSENNTYQPPVPDKLMTKEELIEKMGNEGEEYRWNTAFQVLFNYISKQNGWK